MPVFHVHTSQRTGLCGSCGGRIGCDSGLTARQLLPDVRRSQRIARLVGGTAADAPKRPHPVRCGIEYQIFGRGARSPVPFYCGQLPYFSGTNVRRAHRISYPDPQRRAAYGHAAMRQVQSGTRSAHVRMLRVCICGGRADGNADSVRRGDRVGGGVRRVYWDCVYQMM